MKNTTKKIPLAYTAVNKVLPWIKQYHTRYGYMPSNREIATAFKKRSAWWGNLVLQKLVTAKLIKIAKGKRRSITIK